MTGAKLPNPSSGFELTVDQVSGLLPAIADGSLQFIDCREQDEWDFTHLPNADLIPLSSFSEKASALIGKELPVVVYCHHGIRSLRAASWLRSRGLDCTWSMKGGIDAWSEKIDTTIPRY